MIPVDSTQTLCPKLVALASSPTCNVRSANRTLLTSVWHGATQPTDCEPLATAWGLLGVGDVETMLGQEFRLCLRLPCRM